MKYLTKENQQQELRILNAIKPHVFEGIRFKHQTGTSIYDFKGYFGSVLVAEVDVKSRGYHADDFPEYFVEPGKVYRMKTNRSVGYYIAFYFEKDKRIRVFYLNDCPLEEKEIEFSHKRDGHRVKKKIFCVPARQFIFEAYLI